MINGGEMQNVMTYFENHKTLPSLAPSDDRFIGRVFKHSRVMRLAGWRIPKNRNLSKTRHPLLTCTTCEPREALAVGALKHASMFKDSRNRWNCWPWGHPYHLPCPWCLIYQYLC
jgi:hypothetical protein